MKSKFSIAPDWRWGTPEGSREFDRLTDRMLTFREKLEWLEAAETLSLRLQSHSGKIKAKAEITKTDPETLKPEI